MLPLYRSFRTSPSSVSAHLMRTTLLGVLLLQSLHLRWVLPLLLSFWPPPSISGFISFSLGVKYLPRASRVHSQTIWKISALLPRYVWIPLLKNLPSELGIESFHEIIWTYAAHLYVKTGWRDYAELDAGIEYWRTFARRLFYANVNRYRLDFTRRNDFVVARLAPQTEHLPSAVIFGSSFTSVSQSPHFGIKSPPSRLLSTISKRSCQ